jgi:hypothetical protein
VVCVRIAVILRPITSGSPRRSPSGVQPSGPADAARGSDHGQAANARRETVGVWRGVDRIPRPAPRPTDDVDRTTRAASLPQAAAVLFCTVSKRRRGVWRFLARAVPARDKVHAAARNDHRSLLLPTVLRRLQSRPQLAPPSGISPVRLFGHLTDWVIYRNPQFLVKQPHSGLLRQPGHRCVRPACLQRRGRGQLQG